MRKILFVAIAIIVFINSLCYGSEKNSISTYINGGSIDFETNVKIIDKNILFPLIKTLETLRYEVEWNENDKSVTAKRGDTNIVIYVDNNNYIVNGTDGIMESPAVMSNDVVMIPSTSFDELFNCRTILAGKNYNVLCIDELFEIEKIMPLSSISIDDKPLELDGKVYKVKGGIYIPGKAFFGIMGIPIDVDMKSLSCEFNVLGYMEEVTSKNIELVDNAVIPDKETAYAIGKAILESKTGRQLEYTAKNGTFYLETVYMTKDNSWLIRQRYKNSVGRTSDYGSSFPYIVINKNTGEVTKISTVLHSRAK